jgi:hypothetical protein
VPVVSETWPPLVDVSTVWRLFPVDDPAVREDGSICSLTPTRLRVVRLWGSDVAIDERERVVCRQCLRLLTVEDLADDLFGSRYPEHKLGLPWRLPVGVI